jgi:hypothetical protein
MLILGPQGIGEGARFKGGSASPEDDAKLIANGANIRRRRRIHLSTR